MKSKKILLPAFLILAFTFTVYGQVKIGFCGGMNSAVYKSNDVLITDNNYKISFPSYNNMGYHFGLIGQVRLLNVFIQPEMVFTRLRHDITAENTSTKREYVTQENINRIDIPILLGYKFSALKIEAGPVASFNISDKSDLKKITTYDMQFNKSTFGFQAGAGLQVSKLIIDIKYEGGLSNLGKSIKAGDSNLAFDSRTHQFIVNVGILL